MASSTPRVSVVLAAFNQEKFVAQSIESVLDQNRGDMEILIADDHSHDRTYEIITDYARRYPEAIVAWRNDANLGITENCNSLLRRCRGEFVVFQAGDDLMLPGKITAQVDAMERDDAAILCFHNTEMFDSESDQPIRLWNDPTFTPDLLGGDARRIARLLVERGTSFMAATTVAVRRRAIPPAGFNTRVPVASDWLFWVDVCASNQGSVKYIDRVLSRYRRHPQSATQTLSREGVLDRYVTLAIIEAHYPWLRREVRHARGRMYYVEASQALRERALGDFLCLAKEGMHQRMFPVLFKGDMKKILYLLARFPSALVESLRGNRNRT